MICIAQQIKTLKPNFKVLFQPRGSVSPAIAAKAYTVMSSSSSCSSSCITHSCSCGFVADGLYCVVFAVNWTCVID